MGMLAASVQYPRSGKRKRMDFYVAATHDRAILGMKGCQEMNLLYIDEDNLCTIESNGKIKPSANVIGDASHREVPVPVGGPNPPGRNPP